MTNNNNLYDLPKTATISYFDVETGQNLTAEEWNQLHPNSSEIKVIDKSGNNFVSEKALNGVYGPGNSPSSQFDCLSSQNDYNSNSREAKQARLAGKVTFGIASKLLESQVGPEGLLVIGGISTLIGRIGEELSDDKDFKDAFKYVNELGSDTVKGYVMGNTMESFFKDLSSLLPNASNNFKELYDLWELQGGKDGANLNFHKFHLDQGINHVNCCKVCNL